MLPVDKRRSTCRHLLQKPSATQANPSRAASPKCRSPSLTGARRDSVVRSSGPPRRVPAACVRRAACAGAWRPVPRRAPRGAAGRSAPCVVATADCSRSRRRGMQGAAGAAGRAARETGEARTKARAACTMRGPRWQLPCCSSPLGVARACAGGPPRGQHAAARTGTAAERFLPRFPPAPSKGLGAHSAHCTTHPLAHSVSLAAACH